MSYARAQQALKRKIYIFQVLMVSGVAGLFGVFQAWQATVAVIYGALIVLLNHLLQVWQLKRADRIAGLNPGRNLRYLYRCAAERFTATVALLAVGIALLRLEPVPLFAGYVIAQVALVYKWFLESSVRRKHG